MLIKKETTVFVYGKQVNDFHIVDYDALSMLNVSATQALSKRNKALEAKQSNLNTSLNNIEQQALKLDKLEVMLLQMSEIE